VLTRLVARAVDDVVAVTERQVAPLGALGYPRGRIEVVPNGVFARDVEGVEPSPELDGESFAVLCVAGLRPEKRVDLFIEAVAEARRENPAVRGYVAGEGRERGRLERLAGDRGVSLLGDRRDVLSLVAAAGAVCLPSEAEALPMSLIEAMALARPVIATDVGGTRDLIVDGETGHLVRPGDGAAITRALLALAADEQRAREMGAAGQRRQRERFTGEAMVDGYERAFREAVARGQG
jgi:glycosyltransferase involved in cell wall biosynthesis